MKYRKARFDAYRDMRLWEQEDRARDNIRLAGPTFPKKEEGQSLAPDPLLPAKFRNIVGQIVEGMKQSSFSAFELEGPGISGLRSALCLSRYRWRKADSAARDIVSEALSKVGARRPSYDEAQREATERDGVCIWCKGDVPEEMRSNGRWSRFCSTECAASARHHRDGQWTLRTSSIARAAAATLKRESLPNVLCQQCEEPFRPFAMDARGRQFCSTKCAGDARRVLPDRKCPACDKTFRPRSADIRYCSFACGSVGRRKLEDRSCEQCRSVFRPIKPDQRFCSVPCRNRFGVEPTHQRDCTYCGTSFLGKHVTSSFCSRRCKSLEFQFRTGRMKSVVPHNFDHMLVRQGVRLKSIGITDALFEAA